jgi:hypothetical protein
MRTYKDLSTASEGETDEDEKKSEEMKENKNMNDENKGFLTFVLFSGPSKSRGPDPIREPQFRPHLTARHLIWQDVDKPFWDLGRIHVGPTYQTSLLCVDTHTL